jgi:hypothetical protein
VCPGTGAIIRWNEVYIAWIGCDGTIQWIAIALKYSRCSTGCIDMPDHGIGLVLRWCSEWTALYSGGQWIIRCTV